MPSSEFGSMNAAGAFMQFGSNNWKCQLVAGSRGYGYTNTNGYSTPEGLYFRKHGEITHGAEGYGWTPWREIVSVDNAGKLCITHLDSKYHYTDGPTSVNNTLTIPYATNFSNENIYIGGKEALSYKTGTTSNLHLGYGNIGKYSTYINGKSIYMRYGGGTNGLILNNSGNMTIGSSDLAETSAKLYVDGTTKISGAVTMSSGLSVGDIITAHKQIQLYQEDEAYRLTMYENSNIARLYNVSADGQTMGDMYIGSNSNAAIVINSGSYVGIGTTPDKNYKLDVNGNTRISGNTTITGTCSASEGFFDTSDERLKDFQNDIEVDFEKLSKLPKKYFTWKDGDGELQIGTSAQEVQKIYPELVNEDENGTLSVSYNKLSIIALKAVDELYKKNQELEKRLERLEKLLA